MYKKILIILAVIIIAFSAAFIFLYKNIDTFIVNYLQDLSGCTIDYADFKIDLLSGFIISNLTVKFPQDTVNQSISSVSLNYSFKQLLQKHLLINKIEIISPSLILWADSAGVFNVQRIKFKTDFSDTIKTILPIVIDIESTKISDTSIELYFDDNKITALGKSILIDDIEIKSADEYSLCSTISGVNVDMKLPQTGISLKSNLYCQITINQDSVLIDLNNEFDQVFVNTISIPDFVVALKTRLYPTIEELIISPLTFYIPGENKIHATIEGIIDSLLSKPSFKIDINVDTIDIANSSALKSYFKNELIPIPGFNFKLNRPASIAVSGSFNIPDSSFYGQYIVDISGSASEFNSSEYSVDIASIEPSFNLSGSFENNSLILDSLLIHIDASQINYFGIPDFSVLLDSVQYTLNKRNNLYYSKSHFSSGFGELQSDLVVELPSNLLNTKLSLSIFNQGSINLLTWDLNKLGIPDLQGIMNGNIILDNQNNPILSGYLSLNNTLRAVIDSTWMDIPFDTLYFNCPLLIDSINQTDFTANLDFTGYPYFNFRASTKISSESISFNVDSCNVFIAPFAELPLIKQNVNFPLNNQIYFSGRANIPFEDINTLVVNLEGGILPFDFQNSNISVEDIAAVLSVEYLSDTLSVKLKTSTGSIDIPIIRKKPWETSKGKFDVFCSFMNDTTFFLVLDAGVPNTGISVNSEIVGKFLKGKPQVKSNFSFAFDNDEPYELFDRYFSSGKCKATLSVDVEEDTVLLTGFLDLQDFNLLGEQIEASGVGGRLPFEQKLTLIPFAIEKDKITENIFYSDNKPYNYSLNDSSSSALYLKKIKASDKELNNLYANAFWKNGILKIGEFNMELFGGNMAGEGWLCMDSLEIGNYSYHVKAVAAEINSDLISGAVSAGKDESSRISFILDFTGKQFDPADSDFDLNGTFNITKISPRVAENLLVSLDPRQEDKGIQSMLYFLQRGWGIKSFSFTASNGFVYSTILTSEPPFTKPAPFLISRILPIEKEITLSRLPVKFFLK